MSALNFPLHNTNRKRASVANVYEQIQDHILPAINAVLPTHELTFSGQVLEVRTHGSTWVATVRDTVNEKLGLQFRLPAAETPPTTGTMLRVLGRLTVLPDSRGQIEVRVEGQARVDDNRPARRYLDHVAHLEALKAEIQDERIRDLRTPIEKKVGLVTGRKTDADLDFHRGLNPKGQRPIDVKRFSATLADPVQVADAIHRAADDDDVDVIAIVRGGGNALDVHCFDQAIVLEAIADAVVDKCVVVGIGHAKNTVAAGELASHAADVPQSAGLWLREQHRRAWAMQQPKKAIAPVAAAPAPSVQLTVRPAPPAFVPFVSAGGDQAPEVRRPRPRPAPPSLDQREGFVRRLWRRLMPFAFLTAGAAGGWYARPVLRPAPASAMPFEPASPTEEREVRMRETPAPRKGTKTSTSPKHPR